MKKFEKYETNPNVAFVYWIINAFLKKKTKQKRRDAEENETKFFELCQDNKQWRVFWRLKLFSFSKFAATNEKVFSNFFSFFCPRAEFQLKTFHLLVF